MFRSQWEGFWAGEEVGFTREEIVDDVGSRVGRR